MPYITKERRNVLDLNELGLPPKNCGELNYAITKIVKAYLDNEGTSYRVINDIVGALEGAKLEFYARVARPYEDKKIVENGDVY